MKPLHDFADALRGILPEKGPTATRPCNQFSIGSMSSQTKSVFL
jgi:hypothetical protein